jgi:uridine kinase
MTQPYIIGITGGSGSGKTHFLKHLMRAFNDDEVCLISQDNYYRPREIQPSDAKGIKNFDLPESIDYEQYTRDILSLREGKTVEKQEYTFNNPHASPKTLIFKPRPVLVVEGLFVFYFSDIARLLDLKIFIEAKDHIKIKRRIIRDNLERGYDLDDVLYRYEHHVMPAYERFISPYKSEADFIIPNDRNFDTALEVIVNFLKQKIQHADGQ